MKIVIPVCIAKNYSQIWELSKSLLHLNPKSNCGCPVVWQPALYTSKIKKVAERVYVSSCLISSVSYVDITLPHKVKISNMVCKSMKLHAQLCLIDLKQCNQSVINSNLCRTDPVNKFFVQFNNRRCCFNRFVLSVKFTYQPNLNYPKYSIKCRPSVSFTTVKY